jgi:hypothetical protein
MNEKILDSIIVNSIELNKLVQAINALEQISLRYSNKKATKRFREARAFLQQSACQSLLRFSESIGEMLKVQDAN